MFYLFTDDLAYQETSMGISVLNSSALPSSEVHVLHVRIVHDYVSSRRATLVARRRSSWGTWWRLHRRRLRWVLQRSSRVANRHLLLGAHLLHFVLFGFRRWVLSWLTRNCITGVSCASHAVILRHSILRVFQQNRAIVFS